MRGVAASVVAAVCLSGGVALFGGGGGSSSSSAAAAPWAAAAAVMPSSDVAALPAGAWGLTAYGGYVVFSARASTAGRWQLMAWHNGVITALPVPARPVPFDADAGPDANGNPAVVYSRCATEPGYGSDEWELDWANGRGCRIWELSLLGGVPARVSEVGAPGASDTAPTIWGGAIAFARVPAHASPRVPEIYLWRAGRPLRRLPAGSPPCPTGTRCPNSHAWAISMSLDGSLLAIDWELRGYHVRVAGCGPTGGEVREVLADERSDGAQTIADTGGFDGCDGDVFLPISPSAVGGSILYDWEGPSGKGPPFGVETEHLVSFTPASRSWATASVVAGPAVPAVPFLNVWITGVAVDGPTTYWVSYTPNPIADTGIPTPQYAPVDTYPPGVCDPSLASREGAPGGSCELEETSVLPLEVDRHHLYFLCPADFYNPDTSPLPTCDTRPGTVAR
jgi:hypothetical protein